ncbi:MAG: transcription termination factor Rho [Candidatus Desulfofervidus auxilii]|nr:transcription termination factor Rho [Candidatus Desulfofervidus auxilii]
MEETQEKLTLPDKPIEKLTIKELREIALKIPGVEGVHGMNKEELIILIKRYFGIKEEKKKDVASIRELKRKIKELKAKKEEARARGDKKMVEILRRRISRLKKRTRRLAA